MQKDLLITISREDIKIIEEAIKQNNPTDGVNEYKGYFVCGRK